MAALDDKRLKRTALSISKAVSFHWDLVVPLFVKQSLKDEDAIRFPSAWLKVLSTIADCNDQDKLIGFAKHIHSTHIGTASQVHVPEVARREFAIFESVGRFVRQHGFLQQRGILHFKSMLFRKFIASQILSFRPRLTKRTFYRFEPISESF
jgi:hypothetical protein